MTIKSGKFYRLKQKGVSFFTKISIPGIPSIFSTENIFFKLLWAFLVLTSFSVGFYNIADLTQGFYKYEVITNVERFTEKNFTVPITICFVSSYQRSYYRENKIIDTANLNNASIRNFIDFELSKRATNLEFFKATHKTDCLRFNGAIQKQLLTVNTTNEEFLLIALYNEYREDISNNEYFVYKSNFNYFIVFITDNYLDEFDGMVTSFYSNGKIHSINIVKSETEEKLGEPYNSCKVFPNEKYHKKNCISMCVSKKMSNIYNCTLKESLFKIDGFEQCEKSVIENSKFSENLNFFAKECEADCPESCESIKFNTQISQFSPSDFNLAADKTAFSFQVSDLSYLKITQIPKKTTFEFISADIGGALGLFMGIVCVNFIEIFEFFVDMALITFS